LGKVTTYPILKTFTPMQICRILGFLCLMILIGIAFNLFNIFSYRVWALDNQFEEIGNILALLFIANIGNFLVVIGSSLMLNFFWNQLKHLKLLARLAYLVLSLLVMSLLCYRLSLNGFPGRFAAMEARDQWATQTFRFMYTYSAKLLKECPSITHKIGKIKAIAPTEGDNREDIAVGPFTHTDAYFTLELIGEKGHGLAKMEAGYDGDATFEDPPGYTSSRWDIGKISFSYVVAGTSERGEIHLWRSDCLAK
jgi:hypothetical protein